MSETLKTKTLQSMMAEPSETDDQMELEYRRGFADAIGMLFQQSDTFPPEMTRAQVEAALWRWWGKLVLWEHGDALQAPAFEWRGE